MKKIIYSNPTGISVEVFKKLTVEQNTKVVDFFAEIKDFLACRNGAAIFAHDPLNLLRLAINLPKKTTLSAIEEVSNELETVMNDTIKFIDSLHYEVEEKKPSKDEDESSIEEKIHKCVDELIEADPNRAFVLVSINKDGNVIMSGNMNKLIAASILVNSEFGNWPNKEDEKDN